MTTSPRLVLVTNGSHFMRLIVDDLFRAYGDSIERVVIITGDYKGRTGFAMLRWLFPSMAFPYLLYKIVQALAFAIAARLRPGALYDLQALARARGIPVFVFRSIKDEDAIRCVEEAQPDLLVSVSCPQRIGDRVLRAARRGGINTHASMLPRYAGLAPYFWVLAEGEQTTGITIHYMTSNFDEGNILAAEEVDIAPRESAFTLFRRLCVAGSPLLVDAARRALDGDPGIPQNKELHSYRSHPDFRSYRRLRRRGHRLMRLGELWRALRDVR
jgi:folate-dependent phosphoribosylglycinamide formyltransferase PurN